ncbi:tetratricopeptide repeat protein [Corallococcus macrosporus]|uniref:Putative adventurous gliding motility protein n=1 Tax=Myxococcus fulvus (strain ATCC BAA-855 / HW-1) TaxID=483219 RepID=F8CIU5_MYXFH|nr:zinc-ribbon domain-containing protein [Corallococcus macrosporus]AEI66361.1 putative adventurous gliding motility protein [Corallococcus macrosporus]
MRIVCQKCAAAYAIDDKLITAKGVRAQCPRCRHLQLVRRDPSAAPAPAPQPPVTLTPVSGAGAAPAPNPADDLFGDFGAPPPAAAPAPTPARSEGAAGSDLFGDFGAMPAPAPASSPPVDPFADLGAPAAARGPAAEEDPLLDFLGPPPSAPQGLAPRAERPAKPAAPKPPATAGCRVCQKPLTDSFDQALGICDDCRQPGAAQVPPAAASGPAAPAASADDLPPMADLGAGPSSGGGAQDPQPEPRGGARVPISTDIIPDMGPEPRSGARGSAPQLGAEPRSGPRAAPVRTSAAQHGGRARGGRGGLVAGLVGLVVVGGGVGGYFLYQQQQTARRNEGPPPAPAIPDAVQAVLPRWKLKYLEISGTSAERLAQGQQQLARDERFGYAEAEESFQQALLLDPTSDAAIAGYVQALALGRGARMDDATFQEARALLLAAESRSGRTAPLLLAHANLLLARSGQPEQARPLAEELLARAELPDAQKAEAHLVLGRTWLSSSRELARSHFDSAQKLAPDIKRLHYYRALAHASGGEYSAALDTLRERLEANPKDWESLALTARLYQEVGEPGEARKLYEARVKAEPGELRALLPLAMLRYQSEGSAAGAVRELRALLRNRARYDAPEVAEVLVHLAAAERTAGSQDAAAKSAEEALRLVKDLPEAHLQLFLVALGRRDAEKARAHLPGFRGQLEDGALEKVLEGRLLLLEKQPLVALEAFQAAVKLDARRLDAQLLAGVAAASAKRRDDAFRALHQALQSDPLRLEPRPVMSAYWVRPRETVDGVEGVILALAEGPEDPSPLLYEGLLRFHQHQFDAAERHFRSVLEVDANNAGALAYRSLIALQRGAVADARRLGERSAAAGRQMPVSHLALGLARAESRQVEPAKRALRDALALAPTLLSAQARLANLESPQGKAAAKDTLVKVVGLDPAYLPAKRMLYLLER